MAKEANKGISQLKGLKEYVALCNTYLLVG